MKLRFFRPSPGAKRGEMEPGMAAADSIRVSEVDFDVSAELAALHRDNPQVGAVASFVGYVRGSLRGDEGRVGGMTLEHYPGMTEKSLAEIVSSAHERWHVDAIRVIHRVGWLAVGAQIVFVGVASAHRHEAFAACAFIMDYLKTAAPFWKKERTEAGERWVKARESDTAALQRWQDMKDRQ